MTDRTAAEPRPTPGRVPGYVPFLNRFARRLLRLGTPMGPNALVTVVGRTSGLPRTTPLAIIEHGGRRWIWSPFGEVDWVRNLRVAGRATITIRHRDEHVRATELDARAREAFFRDDLTAMARSLPLGPWFIRAILGVDLNDPAAALDRPVFELHPSEDTP